MQWILKSEQHLHHYTCCIESLTLLWAKEVQSELGLALDALYLKSEQHLFQYYYTLVEGPTKEG